MYKSGKLHAVLTILRQKTEYVIIICDQLCDIGPCEHVLWYLYDHYLLRK